MYYITYFIIFLTILSLVYAGYTIFYYWLLSWRPYKKKHKIKRARRKYDTIYITKEIFLSEDESHWADIQEDGYTIVVLEPLDEENNNSYLFRQPKQKKFSNIKNQMVLRGLEQAKRREFSNNPPDLDIDSIKD